MEDESTAIILSAKQKKGNFSNSIHLKRLVSTCAKSFLWPAQFAVSPLSILFYLKLTCLQNKEMGNEYFLR